MKRLVASLALAVAVHVWLFGLERPARSLRIQPPRPRPVTVELAALPKPEPPPPPPPPEPLPPPPPEQRPAPAHPKPKPASKPRPVKPAIAPAPVVEEPVQSEPAPPPPRSLPVPSVTAPAPPPPPAPVLVQATPRYRDNPAPLYPNQARRRGLEGTVVLEVLVGPDGRVKDLKLAQASGHRLLDEAASDSVRSWAFEPGRRGDQPLEMWVRVPVRFELH